jgi:hypothetical protein
MAYFAPGTVRRARAIERRQWLMDRPHLIATLPSDRADVTEAQSAQLTEVALAMRVDGLYARSTPILDIKWGIRLLVGELQRSA